MTVVNEVLLPQLLGLVSCLKEKWPLYLPLEYLKPSKERVLSF